MAGHPAPMTVHLHLHAVHAPAHLSWLASVAVVAAVVLVLLAMLVSGDGTIMSPDQLPQPRNLTSLVR